eukprot:Nk52_evm1s768 gene=Nk52_evmTU1s768
MPTTTAVTTAVVTTKEPEPTTSAVTTTVATTKEPAPTTSAVTTTVLTTQEPEPTTSFEIDVESGSLGKGFSLKFCDEYITDYRARMSESPFFDQDDYLYSTKPLEQYVEVPRPKTGKVVYVQIFYKDITPRYVFSLFTFKEITCGNVTVSRGMNSYSLKLTFNGDIPPNSVVTFGRTRRLPMHKLVFESAFCDDAQC